MQQTLERTLQNDDLRDLCELNSRWNIAFIGLEWASMFLVVYGAEKFFNPFTYVLAVIWIGSRLHALAVLMHEAAHYRLFQNRKVNEFVGEVLCAWPITLTLRGYRNSHLTHHQHTNTDEDPDWEDGSKEDYRFPKTKKQMVFALLRNAAGFGFYDEFTETSGGKEFNQIPRALRFAQLGCYAALVICSIVFSFWKVLLLFWVIPLITSLIFIAYVRAIAEHYGLNYSHELTSSRNTIATFWEGFLLAPYNVGLHLDHHLYPGVPWYKLRQLHAVLVKEPAYIDKAQITQGYFKGVLQECTQPNSNRADKA